MARALFVLFLLLFSFSSTVPSSSLDAMAPGAGWTSRGGEGGDSWGWEDEEREGAAAQPGRPSIRQPPPHLPRTSSFTLAGLVLKHQVACHFKFKGISHERDINC